MQVYFAGANRVHLVRAAREHGATAFLIAWGHTGDAQFERILPLMEGCSLMLDPGYNRPGRFEDYVAFAKRWGYLFEAVLAWDVPGGSSEENVYWLLESIRAKIPNLMPVFHPGMPAYFLRYWDRVALGGLLRLPLRARIQYLDTLLYDQDGALRYPHLRLHGLGQDHPVILARYPWASVDSGTWANPIRYGRGDLAESVEQFLRKADIQWRPPRQVRVDTDWSGVLATGVRVYDGTGREVPPPGCYPVRREAMAGD